MDTITDKLAEALRDLTWVVHPNDKLIAVKEQSFDRAVAALAAYDAQPAQVAHNSLPTGTTPDGRHYGLTGSKESVEIVSDLIEAQAAQPVGVPDVDHLAQLIRSVDGDHSLGAGQLAKEICDWLKTQTPAQPSADAEDDPMIADSSDRRWEDFER